MSLINSYALWNNKGGVGKSTITFHLASRYAERYPNRKVLVIDLCPQANSSMMLLGGGSDGEIEVMGLCTAARPKTVVGYLTTVITNGQGAALPNPNDFALRVYDRNSAMPQNIFLLCGDGNLEPITPAINNQANAMPLTPQAQPWVWIHNIFREFITNFVSVNDREDVMVFIDTNPSFGIYTELAITAADRLICPVNADDSSRTAASAMTILLHGSIPPHPVYGGWTFAAQAQKFKTNIPKIHLVVGNRLTQYVGAAIAFNALSDATAETLYAIYENNPEYFTPRTRAIKNLREFRSNYAIALRDFNTSGVVTAHLGERLNAMNGGHYYVYGQKVQINRVRVEECLAAVDEVINHL